MSKVLRRRMVDELVKKYEKHQNFVLVSCQGMTGNQAVELRRELRTEKAKMTVLKNSVAHHAFEKLGLKDFQKHLVGMNAVVYGPDAVSAAKKLVAFREKNDKGHVKLGMLEGKPLSPEQVTALSKLPGRLEMASIFLGTLQAPTVQFVSTLNECVRKFLGVLVAIEDQQKAAVKT